MREGARGARFTLELAAAGDPIQGSIEAQDRDAQRRDFFGWIELIEAIESLRGGSPAIASDGGERKP